MDRRIHKLFEADYLHVPLVSSLILKNYVLYII